MATLALVVRAWRDVARRLVLAIITLRVISGLSAIGGLGESATVVTISLIGLALTVAAIYLLRNWLTKSPTAA